MRFHRNVILTATVLGSFVSADDGTAKKYEYQSDVSRLRNIVINSLYSHKDVFLRELISNANDALEKLRLVSLTDKSYQIPESPLNITIKLVKDAEGSGGRVIIADTGIGMTADELAKNLGTLAKSGTSEFLNKAEKDTSGNLIGQFGLGFYSSFLVADKVQVASLPPISKANPDPLQHIFTSGSDDSSFEISVDPRGNSLGHSGTEITMYLKDEALEFLDEQRVRDLVSKHSAFATSFPLYLQTFKTEEVPDEEAIAAAKAAEPESTSTSAAEAEKTKATEVDEDEAIIEDVKEDEEKKEEPAPPPTPMKNVTTEEWVRLNDQAPLWMRDSKDVTKQEVNQFFMSTFKEHNGPLAHSIYKGDSGPVSFRTMFFIPSELNEKFWQTAKPELNNIRLMVKRVFITSDLGANAMPKWLSWLKAIVDADDLPLNVSRETLQSNRFLRQIPNILVRRFINLVDKMSKDEENPELFAKFMKIYGSVIKLGAVETPKEQQKLAGLARWDTNLRNFTTLDQYVENRKKGQSQIFYLAGIGQRPEELAKSLFVEKLHARGYEVLLLNDPMDEILMSHLRNWKGLQFQDAAKKGLKFGDEDEDAEEEKARQEELKVTFKPLLEYLKNETSNIVLDVVLSNRLVTSPCAIVADSYGYSANMERLMAAQTGGKMKENDFMHDWAKKQKFLEINPNSPLIEGMLKKVQVLVDVEEGEERDSQLEEELKEVASILVDGALVRSGFEVPDSNLFFTRMDRVLRRSLGVSETAKGDETVKPAPPVDDTPLEEPGVLPEGAFEDIIDNTADQQTFQPKVDVKVDALNDEAIEEMLNKKEQEIKHEEL
ncbi:Endoplasmin AltName: Full=94 kDa glucose-regulated protein [Rhizoctonia solani AG-1 IB]|uniref:Tra1 protein n=1 Tax=Thanatephorus cucumeris (strain AG1-IB / isolate 7/3/14) TaxID=1108050 RepID=M5CEM1_THACB|nr:Endoplasmin AltName: Full=94 kDa glucose-regulated protein [Rhizoctonia solani AG-1 IB]